MAATTMHYALGKLVRAVYNECIPRLYRLLHRPLPTAHSVLAALWPPPMCHLYSYLGGYAIYGQRT